MLGVPKKQEHAEIVRLPHLGAARDFLKVAQVNEELWYVHMGADGGDPFPLEGLVVRDLRERVPDRRSRHKKGSALHALALSNIKS